MGERLFIVAAGMVVMCAVCTAAAHAAFEARPPTGAGPAAGELAVVEAEPVLSIFHNPALMRGTNRGFVGAAGGDRFGMKELRHAGMAGGFVLRGVVLAAGFASLGDELYRETSLAFGAASGVAGDAAVGVTVELDRAVIASRRSMSRWGLIGGLALSPGDWRLAGSLARFRGEGSVHATTSLKIGVTRTLPGGVRLSSAYRGGSERGGRSSLAWSVSCPVSTSFEVRVSTAADGWWGFTVALAGLPMDLLLSTTSHPLLGATPEGGVTLHW